MFGLDHGSDFYPRFFFTTLDLDWFRLLSLASLFGTTWFGSAGLGLNTDKDLTGGHEEQQSNENNQTIGGFLCY